MGNTKHRKNHKKKVQARKSKMTQDKNRMQKMQKEFIMDLIKKEQERGAFKDNSTIQPVGVGNDVGHVEGPAI